jgi:hypothetical protein
MPRMLSIYLTKKYTEPAVTQWCASTHCACVEDFGALSRKVPKSQKYLNVGRRRETFRRHRHIEMCSDVAGDLSFVLESSCRETQLLGIFQILRGFVPKLGAVQEVRL